MIWQDHIVSDKQILLGKPIIKGTRISIELILELFAKGWTEKQILEIYPSVSSDTIRAVFVYLQDCMQRQERKTQKPDLSKFRPAIFWDTNMMTIDWHRQYRAVIKRVFERGDTKEKNEITKFYGKEVIKEVLEK
jgi:uncharacterized protein (DUF433 family)